LFLLGGRAGATPRRVVLPGLPFAPAWSGDGRVLAVEVSGRPPAGSPAFEYRQEPAGLWLVTAAGTHVWRLTPSSWDVTSFAWSPRARRLAAAVVVAGANSAVSAAVAVITVAGKRKVLAAGSYVSGVAWSPGGRQVAAGISVFTRGGWRGGLELLNPAGGLQRVVAASKGNVLELAGWRPDGSGLLYWVDPQGSGSIAADGLALDSLTLTTGRSRTLADPVLVHGSWLAFSPDGRAVAVVVGGDRVIWGGGKHIALCDQDGRCSAVAGPAGVVAVQPSWSPDGAAVAFTQAPAGGPFGPPGAPTSARTGSAGGRPAARSGSRLSTGRAPGT
jgi:TolB protein